MSRLSMFRTFPQINLCNPVGGSATPPGLTALKTLGAYWNLANYSGSGAVLNEGTVGSALDLTLNGTPKFLPASSRIYAWVPPATSTNNMTAPDIAAYTPTTGLDVRVAVAADDWTPAAEGYPVGQWVSGSTCFLFAVTTAGNLKLAVSTNGTSAAVNAASTVATGFTDGTLQGIRAVWDVAGTIKFYTKPVAASTVAADIASNTGWTQLGTTITVSVPTTALANSTAVLAFGSGLTGSANGFGGSYFYAQVIVDGVTQCTLDPAIGGPSAASWPSAEGRTITVNRHTSGQKLAIVDRAMLLFDGVDDYLTCADNNALDFALTDGATLGFLVRQWGNPPSAAALCSKYATGTNVGYNLQFVTTTHAVRFNLFDGTNFPNATGGTSSSGALRIHGGQRDTVADNIYGLLDSTLGTGTADSNTATSANAVAFEVGRYNSGAFPCLELGAIWVGKRPLTSQELIDVKAYLNP